MSINVAAIDPGYNFEVSGVSYIGDPKPGTAMYVSAKVGNLIENLKDCSGCLVFAENGIDVPDELRIDNCFVMTDNPQFEYSRFANKLEEIRDSEDRKKRYQMTDGGYFIGESVTIGEDCLIEPNCLIGHGVSIGDRTIVRAGVTLKNCVIGSDCLINEGAVIGAPGFTMTEDENGNKYRIPTLGKVIIGNHVEIGVNDNISCGSAGDTHIDDYAKVDSLVHIGHDVHICSNTEVTSGTIFGGFDVIGEHSFIGLNSVIKNRKVIGENVIVGMGAVVTKSFEESCTIAGNPARIFPKKK